MISERKLRRFQLGLFVAAVALFAVYWFAYRSVRTWASDLDKPTAEAWKNLVLLAQTNANVRTLDEAQLKAAVQQVQEATSLLQQAGYLAWERIGLDTETQNRLKEEFQLLEFDRGRFQVYNELRRAAADRKVHVADAALKGLPEFDPELMPPSLHWAQLAFARQTLATAIAANPRAISNLTVLPVRTHWSRMGREAWLAECPLRLELAGAATSLITFLSSLPLRTNELATAGLTVVPDKHLPLFIDRLILKNSPAALNESTLEVIVTGFCELPSTEGTP